MEQAPSIRSDAVTRNEYVRDVINREKGRLKNYIRRRVSNNQDAEDILQDVFYQFVNFMQMETIEKAASWLFRVAGNRITDLYRKRRPRPVGNLSPQMQNETDDFPVMLEEVLFDPNEDPDRIYMRSSVWPLLADALDELPEPQREVFVMHELEDLSFREISALTGVRVNTLITRKRYAILLLRERLKELYEEFFNE